MKRILLFVFAVALCAPIATAQNLAPELMVDGTCDELVAWSSRPVEEIRADLDAMLGTKAPVSMNESTYKTITGVLERTAVSDAWFARPCTFTGDQLKSMTPLHEAYVGHMADKLAPN